MNKEINEYNNNKPFKKFTFQGSGLSLALWIKNTDKGNFVNTTLEKRYKDEKGEWQSTNTLNPADMVVAERLFKDANDWLGSESE